MSNHVLQDAGRIALAAAIKAQPLHIAIGRGDAAWDSLTPAQIAASVPTDATALVSEIGRRLATVQFVVPDDTGDISVHDPVTDSTQRYSLSAQPTHHLWLRAKFERAEGQGDHVREIAIFIGATPDPALPPGQQWFTPDQLVQPGQLYAMARTDRIFRDGVLGLNEETVLPI